MAISSLQWSLIVLVAAVGFFYVNDPERFSNTVNGWLGKAGIAEVPQAQLYYNVTVRDNAGNEQNFLYEHKVEAARLTAARRDPSSRAELAKEITTPHIPEMLQAKDWKCAVCGKDADTLLLHPLPNQLDLEPPVLKDLGGIPVCSNLDCHDSASGMMQNLYKKVLEGIGREMPEDGGIIEVY